MSYKVNIFKPNRASLQEKNAALGSVMTQQDETGVLEGKRFYTGRVSKTLLTSFLLTGSQFYPVDKTRLARQQQFEGLQVKCRVSPESTQTFSYQRSTFAPRCLMRDFQSVYN